MLTEQFFIISSFAHEAVIWFLLFLSVLSIAVMLDRFFFLKRLESQSSMILSQLMEALESGRNAHMKLVYDKYANLPEGFLVRKAWEHISHKRMKGLEEMLNAQVLAFRPKIEKRLSFLATLGSNAPFIGLLGTIFGVMESFQALGSQDASVNVVMIGISKALVATAVGLIVAIPAITAYNYLQRKLKMIFYYLESMKEVILSFSSHLGEIRE